MRDVRLVTMVERHVRLVAAEGGAVYRLAHRHPDCLTDRDRRHLRLLADNPRVVIMIGKSWALQRRLDKLWPPLAALLRRYHRLENPPKQQP